MTTQKKEYSPVTNHAELLLRIEALKTDRMVQKEELKLTFSILASTLDFVSMFKGNAAKEQPANIVKTGVNMALELIIDMVLGKHRSLKGYLSAILVEKFTKVLIDNNLIEIIAGIGSLLKRKTQYEKSQEQL